MEKRINREYKSTLFVLVFGNRKEDLLDLFNAVKGTSYKNPDEIKYTTLESDRGFFVRLKNDLSFLIDRTMGIYEHQSGPTSANITVRMLHYYSDLLRTMIDRKALYREKEVQIAVPQFIVFYNGKNERVEEKVFHLSDLFERKADEPEIELRVRMLNINAGKNCELMKKCKSLAQYAEFVRRMREALKGLQDPKKRYEAAAAVVDACIQDEILAEVLLKHRDEVIEMYYWEYNEEEHLWAIEQDAEERGLKRGMERGAIIERIRQIIRKVKKGKALNQIADELEIESSEVKPVWEAVLSEAPDYDEEKIIRKIIPLESLESLEIEMPEDQPEDQYDEIRIDED
ncbi:MAG: transposase [Eubacteriales bacterium]|nr:transposase [Eubacteriales bacterium]